MVTAMQAIWLGTQPYDAVYELQCALVDLRKRDAIDDTLLLLEHEPTITLGRGAHFSHLLVSPEALSNRGVALHKTDRGGDITLHAPGQLVAYPIFKLQPGERDVRRFVRGLSTVMEGIVGTAGLQGGTIPDLIGLWTDLDNPTRWTEGATPQRPAKLGAIGVRISRWVTMHGFALNLTTQLDLFRLIVPCGISEFGVTSVEALSKVALELEDAAELAVERFSRVYGRSSARIQRHPGRLVAGADPAETPVVRALLASRAVAEPTATRPWPDVT